MQAIRKRLSYANVMATVAVFMVLGDRIKDGSLTEEELTDGTLTGSKIADSSIGDSKLSDVDA